MDSSSMQYRILTMRHLLPGLAFFVCLGLTSHSYYSSAFAQQTAGNKPMMLATLFGPGAIALPAGQGWKPEMIKVYDEGRRPVAQFGNSETGLTASFILFENLSGKPSKQGYRDDGINPILEHDAKLISKGVDRAAPYYKASLDSMPNDSSYSTPRRVTTDHLVMSLGMGGNLKESRVIGEKAIAGDPDYPINYYNLACIEAEEEKANDAKIHLQQAFDRRAKVMKGEESMPDPTKDDSIY
jgi:hypothetical protein